MNFNSVFMLILCIQLLLTFFAPPIGYQNRLIFPGDLWCMSWVGGASIYFFIKKKFSPPTVKCLLTTLILIGFIYAHGIFRPLISEQIISEAKVALPENDHFQPFREAVIALRFLSWLWGFGVVFTWFYQLKKFEFEKIQARLRRFFCFCLVFLSFLLIGESYNDAFAQWMGQLYSFNPLTEQWQGRAYGPFRSPNETAATLGLCLLLLLYWLQKNGFSYSTAFTLGMTFLGFFLPKTATPFFAFFCILSLFIFLKIKKPWNILMPTVSIVILIPVFYILIKSNNFFSVKWNDFLFRFTPWKIYLETALTRIDWFLVGFGFVPYHADNGYMFLFTRGGLVCLGVFLYFTSQLLAYYWKRWSWMQRSSVFYVLFSALLLDIFVYRSVVTVCMVIGIPILMDSSYRDSVEIHVQKAKTPKILKA